MEDRKSFTYRGWNVHFDPPPIPTRMFDWEATHPDYDGAEDANDNRCLHAGSRAAIQAEIDEWYADNEEYDATAGYKARVWALMLIGVALFWIGGFYAVARSGILPKGW